MRRSLCKILLVTVLTGPTAVVAEESAGKAPPPADNVQEGNKAPAPVCRELPRPPAYIENWAWLAEFTKSDPLVARHANRWVTRQQHVRWKLGLVFVLGAGLTVGSTFARLENDHWTKTTKWGLASGIGITAVAAIVAWALLPDRDDYLAVVNQWNARNPDWPLAP